MLNLILLFALQDPTLETILGRYEEAKRSPLTESEFVQVVERTRQDLEQYLSKSPADPAKALYYLAEVHTYRMDYAKAVETLDALIAKHPKDPRVVHARFMAAELTIQLEKDDDARARIEAWRKDYPNDERQFQARIYLAILTMYQRKFEDAALLLDSVRADYRGKPQEWSAAMQAVICHHLRDDQKAARRVLEEIIERCPDRSFVESAKRLLEEYVHLGKELPSDEVADQMGAKLNLSSHRGKVVVFYFYSSAIPLAEGEVHFLKQAHKHFQDKEVVILGVAIEKGRDRFEQFKTLQQIPWTVYFDGGGLQGALARKYSVRGLPALWILDRQGRARFFNISGRDLRIAVQSLLDEK